MREVGTCSMISITWARSRAGSFGSQFVKINCEIVGGGALGGSGGDGGGDGEHWRACHRVGME